MKDLLVILNPRQIPSCIDAFKSLSISKIWLSNYYEIELKKVVPHILRNTKYDNYIFVADDVVVTQEALDTVRHYLRTEKHPVVTGYCTLDENSALTNLTKTPLVGKNPTSKSYDFYTMDELEYFHDLIPTYFAGMCLTGMSKKMWLKYPFNTYPHIRTPDDKYAHPHGLNEIFDKGYGSDYSMSFRLQEDVVPIVAAKHAYCQHVKEVWNQYDNDPSKRILCGIVPPSIILEEF